MCYVDLLNKKKSTDWSWWEKSKFSEVNKWKIIGIHSSCVFVSLPSPVDLNDCKTMFPHCRQWSWKYRPLGSYDSEILTISKLYTCGYTSFQFIDLHRRSKTGCIFPPMFICPNSPNLLGLPNTYQRLMNLRPVFFCSMVRGGNGLRSKCLFTKLGPLINLS